MRFLPVVVIALSFVACQSCKKPDPLPQPPKPFVPDASSPVTGQDASGYPDSGSPQDAAPLPADAGPPDPCFASIVGPAHSFCGTGGLFFASVLPSTPTSKVRLSSLHPSTEASNRLVVRHVNGSASKMKIVVALTNTGAAPGTFILFKKGVAGPTKDLPVGEELAAGRWSTSDPDAAAKVVVPAGKSVRFDASVEVGLHQGYATMGLYEWVFGQPHTVSVCFVGEREDWSVCPGL